MANAKYVSVHGGHSGEFCHHAKDQLEEIILSYIKHGFAWVGITEHVPGYKQELLYPDQQEAGFTPDILLDRFDRYMQKCKQLQAKYADQIKIYAAMEIETYTDYDSFIPALINRFKPDYIVGSVHFVDDLGFDYSKQQYDTTAKAIGGYDELYCRYFDIQYNMIKTLKPAVVGHFDLIRIFDEEYPTRLIKPEIMKRIVRNLELINDLDLIMDFNLRSLSKGATEPYISRPILKIAREMDIAVVPGDDSHGLDNIQIHMDQAITTLAECGFSTTWKQPKVITYE